MAKLGGGGNKKDAVDEAMMIREWHERGIGASRLYDAFSVAGLRVDAIEPGRALLSFTVPPRLTEEIEIEAMVLGIGATTGCVTVGVRRKRTGEVLAHGRHTKYLRVSSKL